MYFVDLTRFPYYCMHACLIYFSNSNISWSLIIPEGRTMGQGHLPWCPVAQNEEGQESESGWRKRRSTELDLHPSLVRVVFLVMSASQSLYSSVIARGWIFPLYKQPLYGQSHQLSSAFQPSNSSTLSHAPSYALPSRFPHLRRWCLPRYFISINLWLCHKNLPLFW